MNYLGLALVFFGLFFLGYSEMTKNKVNMYNKKIIQRSLIKEEQFLKIQRVLMIVNSIGMIIFGFIVLLYNLRDLYVVAYPFLFHMINYSIIPISRRKQA
ncbi:MAG: hypothetical protein K9L62_04820 [Vallitaleaceae bacterium]|nr:hypothetical protein [Vallitaleaceae bacterium]